MSRRWIESRRKLVNAFFMALGSYIEQEAKKGDEWREQSIGQIYAHLSHEVEEIRRNLKRGERELLIHNCIDAVMLATMLLAKVAEQEGLLDKENLEEKA